MNEIKVYEAVVNMIVDAVNEEYSDDGEARLRIYQMISENFAGMVKSLRKPAPIDSVDITRESS